MPKSKEQKRREAVERLEREKKHRHWYNPDPVDTPSLDARIAKRHAEAKRLREKFNIQ